MAHGAHVGRHHPRGRMVRGRQAQRGLQLRRPPRRGRPRRQGRALLRGRAGRPRGRYLRRPAAARRSGRARAHLSRHRPRRPRRDLPAGARRDDRDHARVRPDRRRALARLRRILGRCRALPSRGHGRQAARHDGRPEPPRNGHRGEVGRRRGCPRSAGTRARARRQAHGPGRAVDRGTRRVVAGRRRDPADDARARIVRLRAPSVHHLHLRYDRKAEGPRAHLGRLPRPRELGALGALRRQARRRALVHRRPRVGHGAHLRDLRAASRTG